MVVIMKYSSKYSLLDPIGNHEKMIPLKHSDQVNILNLIQTAQTSVICKL